MSGGREEVAAAKPALSALLLAGAAREFAGRALAALLHQEVPGGLEIIVLDGAGPAAPPLPGGERAGVRVLRYAPDEHLGRARAAGLRAARAPLAALLEAHDFVFPGWGAAAVGALAGPWAAVAGEEHHAAPGGALDDAPQLLGPWLAPARRGEAQMLPGHNAGYRREALLALGEELAELLLAEPILQWRLRQDGHRLFLEPGVRVAHRTEARWGLLAGHYQWSRCLGAARARVFGWGAGRKLAYAAAAPFLPFLRLAWLGPRVSPGDGVDEAGGVERRGRPLVVKLWFPDLAGIT